ncbi:Hypothetical predicted protein [Mytilus galloprovincialis]|uniref:Uncharacterized protein n=2 Tax=Mytilus galloprovincialis TaxID=29158 RepID=A0A8B6F2T5_MYTGA|nr:Hypothetical predicted protein [Mytilus galloprovincialis]
MFIKQNLASIAILAFIFLLKIGFTDLKLLNKEKNDKASKSDYSSTNTANINGEASLLANLTATILTNYDQALLPKCTGRERVQLDINMAVRQLILLDEPEQIAKFNMWMRLIWTDCRLYWNPEDFGNITEVVLPFDLLWTPDLTLYESVAEEFYGFKDYRPRVMFDGTVYYNFPTLVESVCQVDALKFPYDTQICLLTFGSWVFSGSDLDIFSSKKFADVSSIKDHVEWVVESVPIVRHVVFYPEPYPDVTFYVHIRRKPASYVTNIIIPSLLITLISALGFLLPVESGEKVGLQLTVMLAIFVFQVLVADQLPPSADSTPWISVFLSFTLILCGVASLLQVLVISVHFQDKDMPNWTKRYILYPLALVSGVQTLGLQRTCSQNGQLEDEDKMVKEALPEGLTLWMYLATVLDRVGIFIFLMMFVIGCLVTFDGMVSRD